MEQKSGFNVAKDEEIIESNEKWFKFFVVLPKIITIFFAVTLFILGIVFAVATEMGGAAIPAFWFGGAIYCLLIYAILKLSLAYKILHIYYLKKIANKNVSSEDCVKEAQEVSEVDEGMFN